MNHKHTNTLIVIIVFAAVAVMIVSALFKATTGDGDQPAVATAQSPDISYTLKTVYKDGTMYFEGVGGNIDGVKNPDLHAAPGQWVEIVLINGDGMEHDLAIPDFKVQTRRIVAKDSQDRIVFEVTGEGAYAYYCTLPGHRLIGMEGQLIVGEGVVTASAVEATNIARPPTDLPDPIAPRPPQTVNIELEAVELAGQLADGTTYTYWTFNGLVPGPFVRVQVGDTVNLTLKNREDSTMPHSIDLHAVTGPGGGADLTHVAPGEEKTFTFKALKPGLYVYHCATPSVAHHISNGMYGLILVEPEGGLPPVDREFYVMQGEIYTVEPMGTKGHLTFDHDKMLREAPEYFVFNGSTTALSADYPLKAKVGETVRIYFGVGGPNFTSSFHVIGEIFDRAYPYASLTSPPLNDVQTISVPPGGATMVEFSLEVPGRYILVDHALSRLERGLVGYLDVEGEDAPDIYRAN